MSLVIHVRRATESDAPALADLHLRSAASGFANIFPIANLGVTQADMSADWRARLQEDPGTTPVAFVAEADSKVIGALFAAFDPLDTTTARVGRLYVDPEHWGQGVASRVLDSCLSYLRDHGCRTATAWVMEPNVRARAVIEGLGATLTGARQPTCEKATSVPAGVEDVEYALLLESWSPSASR